jgi:pimeloyl-ACP methyl ester carboxylesterase
MPAHRTEEVSFRNNRGQTLTGRMHLPGSGSSRGLIFCHGLYSSKDATKIVRMSADIAGSGFALLAFDFSFICVPGIFSDFSIAQEVEDLRAAVAFARVCGISELHLMGSSMGGVVSLMYASEPGSDLTSLALIATPVRLGALLEKGTGVDIRLLPESGMTPVDGVPIRNSFFREAAALDLEERAARIKAPALVIHGKEDAVVDYKDSVFLATALGGTARHVPIEGGDHNLTREDHLSIVREEILHWLCAYSRI